MRLLVAVRRNNKQNSAHFSARCLYKIFLKQKLAFSHKQALLPFAFFLIGFHLWYVLNVMRILAHVLDFSVNNCLWRKRLKVQILVCVKQVRSVAAQLLITNSNNANNQCNKLPPLTIDFKGGAWGAFTNK